MCVVCIVCEYMRMLGSAFSWLLGSALSWLLGSALSWLLGSALSWYTKIRMDGHEWKQNV